MKMPNRAVLKRHAKMLFDLERTAPLIQAIQKKVKPGDIVVDVGCGLGILSLAAAKAGAKRVYAMDVDEEALEFAKWQAEKLGMEKKIGWFSNHSYNIDLPEKADLLIQETVGGLAFDENFLPTLIDAKKRFLKKNAKIIPEEVSLYGLLVSKSKKPISKPHCLKKIQTQTAKKALVTIHKRFQRGTSPQEKPAGILVWPKIIWAKGCQTDASPFKTPTHWGQTFLRTDQNVAATFWSLILKIFPHPKNPLYNTQIEWQIR